MYLALHPLFALPMDETKVQGAWTVNKNRAEKRGVSHTPRQASAARTDHWLHEETPKSLAIPQFGQVIHRTGKDTSRVGAARVMCCEDEIKIQNRGGGCQNIKRQLLRHIQTLGRALGTNTQPCRYRNDHVEYNNELLAVRLVNVPPVAKIRSLYKNHILEMS
ncbi:hypothetical protein VTL71DRAFT_5096 [Oculimacula yallundae]|uniref:Uncharacterized protein n=1 Tax=Oculimacula yallundae TaxID=86028 RepID=A0ABR4C1B1_9HELO